MATLRSAGLVRRAFWIRATAIVAVLLGGFGAWVGVAYPAAAIPWALIVSKVLLVFPAILAGVSLCLLMPRRIGVRSDGIQLGPDLRIAHSRVLNASVIRGADSRARLSLTYVTPRGPPRTLAIAIGTGVDLERLKALVAALPSAKRVFTTP